MTSQWVAVLLASVGCYALKLLGLAVPERWLDRPGLRRLLDLLPPALLAALVVVQAFAASSGHALTLDLRAVGLGAGAVALLLRAPFPVVLVAAGGAAAAAYLLLG